METVKLGEQSEGHEDGLSRINVKSDFPLAMKLIKDGQEVPFPETDFSVTARTEGGFLIYKAGRKNGICKHCKQDGDRMIIFFDNHGLGKGRVVIECVIDTPDADYTEDGIRQEAYKAKSPIVLVDDDGDALDLRLPEPRVVEKVVEKETDHYTDLQKKAAEWVAAVLNNEEVDTHSSSERTNVLKYIFGNVLSVDDIVRATSNCQIMEGASEADADFSEKLDVAKIAFASGLGANMRNIFNGMYDAPNLDLELHTLDKKGFYLYSFLFDRMSVNTLTIYAGAFDGVLNFVQEVTSTEKSISKYYKDIGVFTYLTANKVKIICDPDNLFNGWALLSSIEFSSVKCFEIDCKQPADENATSDTIAKLIDDWVVAVRDSNPRLIFRNYKGVATEELKQKVLAKGYPSVEFYLGDEKML